MIIKYQLYIYKLFEKVYELIFDRYPFNIDFLFIIDFFLSTTIIIKKKKDKKLEKISNVFGGSMLEDCLRDRYFMSMI